MGNASNEKLIASITEFATSKKMDKNTVIEMLRQVLETLMKEKFGKEKDFHIEIDFQKGELQIYHYRTIVADDAPDADDPNKIALSLAKKKFQEENDLETGEEIAEEIFLHTFKRRDVMEALKMFLEKKNALEQAKVYAQYSDRIGHIISAEVAYINPEHVLFYDEANNELVLPKSGQIPRERFRKGMQIKVLIEEVKQINQKVTILLNRNSAAFVQGLLALETPEILDKNVVIKGVGRLPGVRSKVIVESLDDRIDAAGACIGPNGRRIQTISRDYLNGERVDIITYTNNLPLLIKRIAGTLLPVKVTEHEGHLVVSSPASQVGLLHHNLPFITQLLGCPVHIARDSNSAEEDVHLDEFADEIEENILAIIKEKQMSTAKSVLKMPKKVFMEKTGLEKTITDKVYTTLAKEFEL